MRRRLGRKERKKQKKILIIGSLSLLLFLCVGYAAFSTNLTLKARGNIKERNNLYVSSNGSDTKGNGTINKPYATIQKAYDSAWQNSTIYVMDDITQAEKTTMDENKDVILTSYSQTGDINSIIRSNNLTTHLIDVQDGILTLKNITINGNDVPSQDSMINVASEVYMEEGTLITKANNINDWGGGFSVNGGTLTMNGGSISGNNTNAGGTAIFVFGDHQEGDNVENNKQGTLILNNGTISNNRGGNGIIWSAGTMRINGGTINNNFSSRFSILFSAGEFVMTNGTISNNTLESNEELGGIVACTQYINIKGTMLMTGGIIENNKSNVTGGIHVGSTSEMALTLDGGSIMNNTSTGYFGGIEEFYPDTYTYKSGVVCGNTPANQYETSATCPNQTENKNK